MLHEVRGGVIWNDPNAQIIFNPVSVSKSPEGQNIFNSNLKHDHHEVYDMYRDYMKGESKKRLLGDIQLVQIEDKKFIMNGFVYYDNILNPKALMKAFVELSNLIEEYHIAAAIPFRVGCKDTCMYQYIEEIINIVFGDCKSDIYIYKKKQRNRN